MQLAKLDGMTPMFTSLLFGADADIARVRDALHELLGFTFREGDSDWRGGTYYEHPASLSTPPYSEHWYIQRNSDLDDLAEQDWPEIPTLVYVEATPVSDDRVRIIRGLGVDLQLLRRDVWPDPRVRFELDDDDVTGEAIEAAQGLTSAGYVVGLSGVIARNRSVTFRLGAPDDDFTHVLKALGFAAPYSVVLHVGAKDVIYPSAHSPQP